MALNGPAEVTYNPSPQRRPLFLSARFSDYSDAALARPQHLPPSRPSTPVKRHTASLLYPTRPTDALARTPTSALPDSDAVHASPRSTVTPPPPDLPSYSPTLPCSCRCHQCKELPATQSTPLTARIMAAARTHLWISLWFAITVPVIFWDVGYCFMRPRSMTGGDLHWIWAPYGLYEKVDYVYGWPAFNRGDGFTNAQSLLNVVENGLNILYLYLAHSAESSSAPLVGFASASMTLAKTVLYWAQEYYCGGCSVWHNDWNTLFWYWIVPNGLWIAVPAVIVYTLFNDLASALRLAPASDTNGSARKIKTM